MNLKSLQVTLTRDRFDAPLVVIQSPLGNGMEASPTQIRALAAALLRVADDAESRPTKGKRFMAEKREYEVQA